MKKDLLFQKTPTKIDVDKLIDVFGIPTPGDMVEYSDIEKSINVERNTHRWASIVTAWRKKLYRENNVLFEAVANKGYLCLDDKDRVSYGSRKVVGGRKAIMKGVNVVMATDTKNLDDETKELYNHIIAIPNRLKLASLTESKALPY